MILDTIENAEKYFSLNSRFAIAFRYLRNPALSSLTVERNEIEGDKLFAVLSRKTGKKRQDAKLEIHRKYIDIQFVIAGVDSMGWKATRACTTVETPYNDDKDIGYFSDPPDTWCAVKAGAFAIFFPEDAHAPMVSDGEIHKVIMKVAV